MKIKNMAASGLTGRIFYGTMETKDGDQLLCKLRADLINKKFCRDVNKPLTFVKVLNVYRAGRGFKVMFRYGDDGHVVYCGYTNFLKRYPEELTPELTYDATKFDQALLINKFYERYPLSEFKNDSERAEALGYFMAGAELQRLGRFIEYNDKDDSDEY